MKTEVNILSNIHIKDKNGNKGCLYDYLVYLKEDISTVGKLKEAMKRKFPQSTVDTVLPDDACLNVYGVYDKNKYQYRTDMFEASYHSALSTASAYIWETIEGYPSKQLQLLTDNVIDNHRDYITLGYYQWEIRILSPQQAVYLANEKESFACLSSCYALEKTPDKCIQLLDKIITQVCQPSIDNIEANSGNVLYLNDYDVMSMINRIRDEFKQSFM